MSDTMTCPFCQGAQRVHDSMLGWMVNCYGCNGTGVVQTFAPEPEGVAIAALLRIQTLVNAVCGGRAVTTLESVRDEALGALGEIARLRGG